MNIKNKILPAIAFAVLATSLIGVSQAHAQTNNNNFFSGLIQYISQKFGLDKSQVQTAVNDYQAKNQQNRQQNMQNKEQQRLVALVKQGKITGDQEKAILAELNILRNKYKPDNSKTLTPEQRKQQMDQEQADLKAWAGANNIDINLIKPGFGGLNPRGFGMHGKWDKDNLTPTPTVTQ